MPERTPLDPSRLDDTILQLLLGKPMPNGRKLLGIEYERLVLGCTDRRSAPVEFCVDLLGRLCERFRGDPLIDGVVLKGFRAREFDMSIEPGGQLEVACPPVSRLRDVEEIMRRVDAAIFAELAGSGYEVVAAGHAPVTPVEEIGLLPRERYKIMDRRMPSRGALTRNMMRATAGFQLTYDIEDRDDAARKLALLYRLSPLFVALTANSRIVAGRDSGWASYRHRVWLETDWMRSGVPDGCLHAETAIDGYVRYARRAVVLFTNAPSGGGLVEAPERSLEQLCADGGITADDVELHLTSLFPFVRLRNYIEVRCLDSIEWSFARSMLALISGIVYCPSATRNAEQLSEALVADDPERLRKLHLDAAKHALGALAPGGTRFRELAGELVRFASATLGGDSCDWAAPEDLDEVRARVA